MKNWYRWATVALVLSLCIWTFKAWPPVAHADDYRTILRSFEIAAPGANVDAITDIAWPSGEAARVTVQLATASVANLMVTRGVTENALGLNSNTALVAGAVFTFDIHGLQPGDTVNFQVETDSVIDILAIGSLRRTR